MNDNKHIDVNCCLVKQTKATAYYVKLRWKEKDKTKQKLLSTGVPIKGNNKRKAQAEAENIRSQFEKELNEKIQCDNDMLFSDFMMHDWLSVKKTSVRQSTYDSYKMSVESGIKPYFDSIGATLKGLKTEDIQGFYDSLIKKNLTANTIKHYHGYLSSALKYAVKRGMIQYNPIIATERPKVERHEAQAFSREQLQMVLKEVESDTLKTAVYLAAYGGLRRSEVLGLQWSDIDFENELIFVHRTRTDVVNEIYEDKTKSKTSKRYIPIAPLLKEALMKERLKQHADADVLGNAYITDFDFVCRYADGRRLKSEYVSKHFKSLLRNIGLDNFNFHCLRHTIATIMANSGTVGIKTVSTFLGHSNLSTTSIYIHADNEAKQAAIKTFSDLINSTDNS